MGDNTTSSPEGDAFAALGVDARTALIILHVTALPLGVFFEFFLIMRLLNKAKKRLWDALTMALEELTNKDFPRGQRMHFLSFSLSHTFIFPRQCTPNSPSVEPNFLSFSHASFLKLSNFSPYSKQNADHWVHEMFRV